MDGQPAQQDDDAVAFPPEEIAGIEDAIADFEASGGIPCGEARAWLDSLESDEPKPRNFT